MPQNGNICVLWVTLAITYSAWLWTRTAIVSLPQLTLWRCLYLCSAASLSAAVGFGLSWLALAAKVAVLASSSGLLIAIFFSAQRCRHLWPERLKLVQGSAWAGLAGRGGVSGSGLLGFEMGLVQHHVLLGTVWGDEDTSWFMETATLESYGVAGYEFWGLGSCGADKHPGLEALMVESICSWLIELRGWGSSWVMGMLTECWILE